MWVITKEAHDVALFIVEHMTSTAGVENPEQRALRKRTT